MIRVKALKAASNLRACKDFIVGHTNILRAHDLANITSSKTEWAFSPSTTLILVEYEGTLIGGARLQIADGNLTLPIEDAVGKMDFGVYDIIKDHSEDGTAEFCGLWNTRTASKLGIGSIFLGKLGLAVAAQLNIKSLFALAAPTTVANCKRVGFKVYENLGIDGTFYYPKLDLVATAMKVENIFDLSCAEAEHRDYILALRETPCQKRVEQMKSGIVSIEFNLIVS